jgi:hypothetical protein
MLGQTLSLDLANRRQGPPPVPALRNPLLQVGQQQQPAASQALGHHGVEPAIDPILRARLFRGHRLQMAEQGQLALTQPAAPIRFQVWGMRFLIELKHLRLGPAIQIPLRNEVLEVRPRIRRPDADGQTDQAPRTLPLTTSQGAQMVNHLTVGGHRLMPMVDAQVAKRRFLDGNPSAIARRWAKWCCPIRGHTPAPEER